MPLPRCFFSIAINGVPSGRIVFELFSDECPKTCENFRYLCTGEKGEGKTTFKPLHYKGTPIHRIVKGFIIQGGDFSNGDGTGGESIYGGMFEDENLKLKHDRPFLLSMANKGPGTNGSQFFITTRPAPHLDGLHVVFGHVIQGKQYVSEIENQKVDANHRPYADVRIANCGELVLLKAGKIVKTKRRRVEVSSGSSSSEDSSEESTSEDESDSGSSSSEEERKRRRKHRKKKKLTKEQKIKKKQKEKRKGKTKKARKNAKRKKKDRLSPSSSSSSQSPSVAEEALAMEEVITSSIATEEDLPPEIVSTTRSWLYRYSKSPSPKEEKEERRKQSQEAVFKHRANQVSNSGRKLKGRGLMRYRTPPRHGDDTNWRYQSDRKESRERTSRRQHSPIPSRRRNRSMSPVAQRYRFVESTQRYPHRRRDAEPMSREYFPSRSRSAERCSFNSSDEGLSLHSTYKKHKREYPDHDKIRRSSKWDNRIIPSHSSSQLIKRSSQHKSKCGPASPVMSHRRGTSSEDSTSRPTSRKLAPSKQTSLQQKYPSDQCSNSDHAASSPIATSILPSKWARHRDSDDDSTCTSDEDQELEMAYQQAQRTSDKDIFGIAELSQQYFNN